LLDLCFVFLVSSDAPSRSRFSAAPKVQYATPYGAYGPKVGQIPNPATRPAAYAPAASYGRLMPPHMLPSLALHLGCMAPQWHLHMERPWDMVPRWGMVPLWVGPRWDLVPQWEVTRVLPQWAMERPLNLARLSSVTESSPIIRKSSGRTEMTRMLKTLVLPLDLRSFPQLAPKLAIFSA